MTATGKRSGILLVLSSPSGAGKSTMARRLLAEDSAFRMSVSATTRPAREGETHGKDYLFVDNAAFEGMVSRGEMLEHAEVFGNRYGTPRMPVEAALGEGKDMLFDVDWQGGRQLRQSSLAHALVQVFMLPPSVAELERRLRDRGQDTAEVIAGRMAKTKSEVSHWEEYDYVLINDDQESCYSRIRTIVNAERLRRERQAWLRGFVDGLDDEFNKRKDND